MPHVSLNGAEIFYEDKGPGQLEVVAFLNGVMMTTASWAYQMRDMRRLFRCILHDTRGQLRSSKTPPYTMEGHADDFRGLLDHLGIDQCHIVGTSYGGEIGMIFAAEHPERVRSLSVVASVSHLEPHLKEQVETWIQASHERETFYDAMLIDNYSPEFQKTQPDLLAVSAERVRNYPDDFFEGFRGLCRSFIEMDIRDHLPAIQAPTLIVAGGEDRLKTPAYSAFLARNISGAEYLLLPGSGHAAVIEQPDALNSALIGFITKHSRRKEGFR
ncbi:MAG: alpha/beta hydrolase [Acidobacteriota bacterium]|nr:alpha/beta hydrolase [Acidobacteriota bacterium]